MRSLKLITIIALLTAIVIPTTVCAQDSLSQAWGVNINGQSYISKQAHEFIESPLTPGLYELTWSGSWSITVPRTKSGSLYGIIDAAQDSQSIGAATGSNYLYKFFYRNDNKWYQIGELFNSIYTLTNPAITTSVGDESDSFTAQVMCDAIGVQYGAYYYGNGGSASGTAGMSAAAVPEPSTLVGFATAIALNIGGVMGYIRRRRI